MKKVVKGIFVISAFIYIIFYVGVTGKDIQKAGEKMWKWAKKG